MPDTIVLMVAEKPSMAAAIAGFLSGGSHTTRHENGCATHDFHDAFQGRRCAMRVTAVKGHVYNLDFEDAYQSWELDPTLLFAAGTVKKPTSGAIVAHLQREAKGCEHLVLWLDCDREGA